MVDSRVAAAEVLAPPVIEQDVRTALKVEFQGPDQQAINAARMIEGGLNSMTDPKKLMDKLIEIPSGNSDRNNSKGVEDSNTQNTEDGFKAKLEAHKQKFALSSPNLEADPKYQQIHQELMNEWELQHPEPHKGKQELTDKEKEEWRDWLAKKNKYKDTISAQAKKRFQQGNPDEFDRYQKYGVYDSLNDDPRFQEIFQRKNLVQHELAKKRGSNLSQSPDQIAFVQSRDEFIRRYPEVAKVYAIKDQDIARVLEIQEKPNQQNTQPQPDTQPENENQPNKQRKTDRGDNQINTGEDGDNRRSGQDRERADADSSKEKTSDEPQETEIQQLKKQIEALTQEIKGLREELEQLKELEAQAGEIVQHLKENPQIAKLLESQDAVATGNEPSESKQSNISKLLEILLLLLAAGGFTVGSEAKKA
jgi:hypothetical protein